jgi:hypothetical protein
VLSSGPGSGATKTDFWELQTAPRKKRVRSISLTVLTRRWRVLAAEAAVAGVLLNAQCAGSILGHSAPPHPCQSPPEVAAQTTGPCIEAFNHNHDFGCHAYADLTYVLGVG